jgi:lipopolysaccharide assembly outer membrane protein LptD (OstA)
MTMDQCDYDDAHQSAVGGGHLKITDPESTITGDKLQVDFNKKFAQIIGNVTIVTQKKKTETAGATPAGAAPAAGAKPTEGEKPAGEKEPTSLGEYREKKTTITCPQIDYYYADDRKQAAITGPVKAVQEDKTVVSDKASYDGVKNTVVLDGNVTVTTDKGDDLHCPSVTIFLDNDSFEASDITGVVIQREEKPAEPTPAPPTPSPEQKGPAPVAPAAAPAPAAGPHA